MSDTRHLLGLPLGTEEDWPTAWEQLVRRLDPALSAGGRIHRYDVERITSSGPTCASPAATAWSSTASRTGTSCHGSG